jgi:hypothetical protein
MEEQEIEYRQFFDKLARANSPIFRETRKSADFTCVFSDL